MTEIRARSTNAIQQRAPRMRPSPCPLSATTGTPAMAANPATPPATAHRGRLWSSTTATRARRTPAIRSAERRTRRLVPGRLAATETPATEGRRVTGRALVLPVVRRSLMTETHARPTFARLDRAFRTRPWRLGRPAGPAGFATTQVNASASKRARRPIRHPLTIITRAPLTRAPPGSPFTLQRRPTRSAAHRAFAMRRVNVLRSYRPTRLPWRRQ
jgi:hypothetical protein